MENDEGTRPRLLNHLHVLGFNENLKFITTKNSIHKCQLIIIKINNEPIQFIADVPGEEKFLINQILHFYTAADAVKLEIFNRSR